VFFPEAVVEMPKTAYLDGTATGLEAGQVILAVAPNRTPLPAYLSSLVQPADPDIPPLSPGEARAYVVRSVEADDDANLTRVAYVRPEAVYTPQDAVAVERGELTVLGQLGTAVLGARAAPSRQPPTRFQLARDPARTYAPLSDLSPRLIAGFSPRAGKPLFAAFASAPVTEGGTLDDRVRFEALRLSASPFGATAPLEFVYGNEGEVSRREWQLAEVRSSLSLQAQVGLGGPDTLAAVFDQTYDLDAGERARMDLVLQLSDPVAAPLGLTISLAELTDTGDNDGERRFRAEPNVGGVPFIIQVTYEDEGGSFVLQRVDVAWGSVDASRRNMRAITVRRGSGHVEPVAILAAVEPLETAIRVRIDGVEANIVAGQPPESVEVGDGRATLSMDATGSSVTVVREAVRFAGTATAASVLSLDAEYPDIVPSGRLAIEAPARGLEVFEVLDVRTAARSDYGVSQTVTHVLLDRPWLSGAEATLADIRGVRVFAQNEAVTLAEEPIDADVANVELVLDGLYEGLEAGRWVAVSGERTDILAADGSPVPEVEATELAMLAGVEHRPAQIPDPAGNLIDLPGDTLHTRLTFAEPLAYTYKRDTVRLNANVVLASHGETVRETLGSGNSAARMQTFPLARDPLTHVSAPTPQGTESTLTVFVNGIRWREGESLLGFGPLDRGFQSRTDNENKTSVTFGDGFRGARVPSGTENVTAEYRVGIGAPGNVRAGQITTLGPKPLGLKEVVNPRAASGGADAESRDQARERVPLATRALDRLVSVDDYTDFAVLYAGIGKARAARLSDGGREVVHLTLAGAADAALDEQSSLWRNLMTSLAEFGDPGVPVVMAPREAAFLFLSARVKVHPDHLWERVEPPLRAALLDAFGFEARELGQPVRLSEVVAVMQAAEGVEFVDVDLFEAVAQSEADTPEALATRLETFANRLPDAVPRPWLPAGLARRDNGELRPAQLIYLNPNLADTLILTEVTS
jgi:predicted phage baseplate assembly protein